MSSWVLGGAMQGLGEGLTDLGRMQGANYFAMAREQAQQERDKNLARFRKELDLEYAGREGKAKAKSEGLVARAREEAQEPFAIAREERGERRGIAGEERQERRQIEKEEREAKRPKITTVTEKQRVLVQRGDEIEELQLSPSADDGFGDIQFGSAPANMEQKDWLAVQKFWRQQAKESYGKMMDSGIMLDKEAKTWAARVATQSEEVFKSDPTISALRAFEMALDRQEAQINRVSGASREGLPKQGIFGMGGVNTEALVADLRAQYPGGARNIGEVDDYLRARGITDPMQRRRIAESFMQSSMVAQEPPSTSQRGLISGAMGGQAPQQPPEQELDFLGDDPLKLFAPQ